MAGDWLKIDKETPEKPEIFIIAEILGIDPEAVFTKCFKVWRWADSHTPNGQLPAATLKTIDRVAGVDGFGAAMQKTGWLKVDKSGAAVPNFDRHMGKGAKRRMADSERQRNHREAPPASRSCHDSVTPPSHESHTESVTRGGVREEEEEDEEEKNSKCAPSACEAETLPEIEFETTAEGLAQAWRFQLRSPLSKFDELRHLTELFAGMIRHKPGAEILAAIVDPARDRTELVFDFKRRLLPPASAGKPKKLTPEEMAKRVREMTS
jgi:hypothetical protein